MAKLEKAWNRLLSQKIIPILLLAFKKKNPVTYATGFFSLLFVAYYFDPTN